MQRISSEFAGFVSDTGVRAFDLLSERLTDLPAALRPLLRAWSKLSETQKRALFDELITLMQQGIGRAAGEEKPSRTAAKRDIRRYEPEEVEATLPAKKPKKKKKPAIGKKKRKSPATG